MIKKTVLFYGMISFGALLQAGVLRDTLSLYKEPIELLSSLEKKQLLQDHQSMVQLFSYFNTSSFALIKQLRHAMDGVKKEFKRIKDPELKKLFDQLQHLSSYVKRHKINNDAILFQKFIKNKYQKLFDMIEKNHDVIAFISENKKLFDLKQDDKGYLDTFLKNLRQVQHRVSEFEDYIHADYIDLKLMNYVFKIELIKLRNAILFDKRYKK